MQIHQSAEDYLETILMLNQRMAITILMVTHDLEFAASYADRCALLFDGRITSEEEPHVFFRGNRFYTTTAGLIGEGYLPGAITCGEVIAGCEAAYKLMNRKISPGRLHRVEAKMMGITPVIFTLMGM